MKFFSRKKTTSATKGIEQQAYMQESMKQAKGIGIARARTEAKQAKKAPVSTGGGFAKAFGSFQGYATKLDEKHRKKNNKGPFGF